MKRVAIFQYQWPLQIHTVNFAAALASEGYHVDLFIKDCRTDLVQLSRLEVHSRVRVVYFDNTTGGNLKNVFRRRLSGLYERVMKRFSYAPIIYPAVINAYRYVRTERYSFFIGVEKMGLIWAGLLSELTGTRVVYYSLELYDEQHPFFIGMPGFPALRRLEKKYHRKSTATIIQDKLRGEYLFRSNGIIDNRLMLLPVSVPGAPAGHKTDFFRAKWGIPPNIPIVLYLGLIEDARHCLNLSYVARDNAGKFSVVYHGYGNAKFLDKIRDAGGEAVVLSTELVPEDLLPDIVASADIGLALYRNDCANDLLTAFSSEKVALYCRAGVPFIAFDTVSYRELVKRFQCCVLIKDIRELPQAVEVILNDYSAYSTNAIKAFHKYYQYEKNVVQVIKELNSMYDRPDL